MTFHRRQKPSEQQLLLANNSLGQLYELRAAIIHRGEKIPGRTGDESLAMVDRVIAWHHAYDARQHRDETRWSLLILLCLAGFYAAAIAALWLPDAIESFLAHHG